MQESKAKVIGQKVKLKIDGEEISRHKVFKVDNDIIDLNTGVRYKDKIINLGDIIILYNDTNGVAYRIKENELEFIRYLRQMNDSIDLRGDLALQVCGEQLNKKHNLTGDCVRIRHFSGICNKNRKAIVLKVQNMFIGKGYFQNELGMCYRLSNCNKYNGIYHSIDGKSYAINMKNLENVVAMGSDYSVETGEIVVYECGNNQIEELENRENVVITAVKNDIILYTPDGERICKIKNRRTGIVADIIIKYNSITNEYMAYLLYGGNKLVGMGKKPRKIGDNESETFKNLMNRKWKA